MAEERSTIPIFNGAAYNHWAYRVQYGLIDKELHEVVFEFHGPRIPCPAPIPLLTQAELDSLPVTVVVADAIRVNGLNVGAKETKIKAWLKIDMKAQAYIVKHLGPSQQSHVRNCRYAHEMWDSLKKFYSLQGEIEVANAQAQLSAIIMTEVESISVYVQRLQDLHGLLDRLEEPVSATKQATNLINSLNSKYSSMVETIQT